MDVVGELRVEHADNFLTGSSTHTYFLVRRDTVLRLRLPSASHPDHLAGSTVRVVGQHSAATVDVSSLRPYATAAAAGGSKGGGGGGSSGGALGERRTLAILFTLPGQSPGALPTDAQVRSWIFSATGTDEPDYATSSSALFRESSHGALTLRAHADGTSADRDAKTGDVTRPYAISGKTNSCDHTRWADTARKAAAADGWDVSKYQLVVHVFPLMTVCNFGGIAQINGAYSWINYNPAWGNPAGVFTHEFGHNLGVHHSRSWVCTVNGRRVSMSGSCSYEEYGDTFDVMGWSRYSQQLNGRQKAFLGWLPSASVQAPSSGAIYALETLEAQSSPALRILQIPRAKGENLYVEYRQPLPAFDALLDSLAYTPVAARRGVMVRTGAPYTTMERSYLVDTTPWTADHRDAALAVGEAFVDPKSSTSVAFVGVDDAGRALVQVTSGVSNNAPAVVDSDSGVTATDTNSNLASYDWRFVSCPGTCSTLSGASGPLSGGSSVVPEAAFDGPTGDYRLSVTVWDALGATATATVTRTR